MNPNIKKDAWTLEEELALINAHHVHGNKWAKIAKVLPGRYSVHAFLSCMMAILMSLSKAILTFDPNYS